MTKRSGESDNLSLKQREDLHLKDDKKACQNSVINQRVPTERFINAAECQAALNMFKASLGDYVRSTNVQSHNNRDLRGQTK